MGISGLFGLFGGGDDDVGETQSVTGDVFDSFFGGESGFEPTLFPEVGEGGTTLGDIGEIFGDDPF